MGGNFDVLYSRTLALQYSAYVGRNVTCLCLCTRDIVVAGSADGLIVLPPLFSPIAKQLAPAGHSSAFCNCGPLRRAASTSATAPHAISVRQQLNLVSDDGSTLYIDGSLVINNNGLHASSEHSGAVKLTKGRAIAA